MIVKTFKFAQKVLESRCDRLRYPYKLSFVVTRECHSRCQNCSIWQCQPQNELGLEEIKSLASNSPFLSWIDFTGGEPTDRDDFVEVVKAFYDSCPDLLFVHFPTNGLKTKRIEKAAAGIAALNVPRVVITVSIDGPPEINDRLRGIPGDFERACDTIKALSKISRLDVYAGMTLYHENVDHVGETVAAIRERVPGFTVRRLHVNLPNVSGHYYRNEGAGIFLEEKMLEATGQVLKEKGIPRSPFDFLERSYQRLAYRYFESGVCPLECAALHASCYLAEDGTVYPCIVWGEAIGNIRETGYSLIPLLESERARELRAQLKEKKCPNCWTPCEAYQSIFAGRH